MLQITYYQLSIRDKAEAVNMLNEPLALNHVG